jgi:Arc/MetJ family transcription regulator
MRTTIDLDEDLFKMAVKMTGITKKTQLLEEGLRYLVRREAAKQLVAMGGMAPGIKAPPRRRFK